MGHQANHSIKIGLAQGICSILPPLTIIAPACLGNCAPRCAHMPILIAYEDFLCQVLC